MTPTNKNQLVTIGDLEAFKLEIITIISQAIKNSKGLKTKKWLKSSEVRKLIGVSPGKLQTIRETGLLSFTKIGGNIYYDQEDIIKLFENNKVHKNEV
jgi:Helix-turn-helix domain